MKIIDISRPLSAGVAVWPGDRPFETEWTARIADGSSVNVGAVALSTHTGTHVDAPLHFDRSGRPVDALPLDVFVGDALVIDAEEADVILPELVDSSFQSYDPGRYRRVLFKTRSSRVPADRWEPDFPAFAVETIDRLGDAGVVLVGTDAPSVDPAENTELRAHHALARRGIVNLENLVLADVLPGPYRLVALPLKLAGMDAAPVRAVLLAGDGA